MLDCAGRLLGVKAVAGEIVMTAVWMRAATVLAALLLAAPGRAQPLGFEGPIHIVCGAAAGEPADLLARLIAEKMQASLKHPVVVENTTGADGKAAAAAVKSAPHDGSQILLGNIVTMVLAPLAGKVGYDPVQDFVPIARSGDYQIALATGALTGATNFHQLVTWLKNNPDKAAYGMPATGGLAQLYGFRFAKAAGVAMTPAPPSAGAETVDDLVGGRLATAFAPTTDLIAAYRAGRIRIAVLSGTRRMDLMPEAPTFGELGFDGFDQNGWNGVFAPADTPPDVVKRYNAAINEALTSADLALKVQDLGFQITTTTPEEFARQLARDRETWRPLLVTAGMAK
jgi:tripartite-type tricarboxylate transporter receptor subunit TctC